MRYISGCHGMIEINEQGWFQCWVVKCDCDDCKEFPGYDQYHYDLMEYDVWSAANFPDQAQPEGTTQADYIDVVLIGSFTADGMYEPPSMYARRIATGEAQ